MPLSAQQSYFRSAPQHNQCIIQRNMISSSLIWNKLFDSHMPRRHFDQEIDVTDKICPLTFVHTRLAIDEMSPGGVLSILLRKGEALENVPRSATELGHQVLSLTPVFRENEKDIYQLRLLIS